MLNALAEFFSPEAGQRRRQWLNEQEGRVGNALAGYLGPAAQPIQSAAMLAGYLSPGADMMEAADASRGMWNADNPLDAAVAGATMIGATGMMFLPGNYNALREGIGSVADDMVAAYDPALVRSGLGPVSETPAQAVARLLREGRAADVTDDMMARVDPQEMFRLYESGATGADMPMDAASRMARAEQMGFDTQTPLYHGTDRNFAAFRVGDGSNTGVRVPAVFASDSRPVAETYGNNVMDLVVRSENPVNVDFGGRSTAYFDGATRTPSDLVSRVSQVRDDVRGYMLDPESEMRDELESLGWDYFGPSDIDLVRMQNVSDSAEGMFGGTVANNVSVFDPRNIRNISARFDPRLAHLANLSAGIGGVAIGLNALAPTQENADRQVLMDWLDSQGL